MAYQRPKKSAALDPQEEIVRLLTLQVRRQHESQTEVIHEMSRAGFGAARIADLLGTTANTVNVTLQKAKRKKAPKVKKAAEDGGASSDT
jgi:DNA-binding CsgD family transcriptional regulator